MLECSLPWTKTCTLFNVLQELLSSPSQLLCLSEHGKRYPPNPTQEFRDACALIPSVVWQNASEHYSPKWLFPLMADLSSVDDHKPYRNWNANRWRLPHIYQSWVKYYGWLNCSDWLMLRVDSAKQKQAETDCGQPGDSKERKRMQPWDLLLN